MFDSDITQDNQAKKITRRLFFGGIAASVVFPILRRSPIVEASETVHGTPGEVRIVNFSNDGKNLGTQTVAKILKTNKEWFQQLGKNSFEITRMADTEMPYTGVSWNEHRHGIFRCICCDTALFSSQTKFESGTGWPSFWAPLAKENVAEAADHSLGAARIEVKCARCEGHLGHVFDDGPEPTGLRYCMNSASMRFVQS